MDGTSLGTKMPVINKITIRRDAAGPADHDREQMRQEKNQASVAKSLEHPAFTGVHWMAVQPEEASQPNDEERRFRRRLAEEKEEMELFWRHAKQATIGPKKISRPKTHDIYDGLSKTVETVATHWHTEPVHRASKKPATAASAPMAARPFLSAFADHYPSAPDRWSEREDDWSRIRSTHWDDYHYANRELTADDDRVAASGKAAGDRAVDTGVGGVPTAEARAAVAARVGVPTAAACEHMRATRAAGILVSPRRMSIREEEGVHSSSAAATAADRVAALQSAQTQEEPVVSTRVGRDSSGGVVTPRHAWPSRRAGRSMTEGSQLFDEVRLAPPPKFESDARLVDDEGWIRTHSDASGLPFTLLHQAGGGSLVARERGAAQQMKRGASAERLQGFEEIEDGVSGGMYRHHHRHDLRCLPPDVWLERLPSGRLHREEPLPVARAEATTGGALVTPPLHSSGSLIQPSGMDTGCAATVGAVDDTLGLAGWGQSLVMDSDWTCKAEAWSRGEEVEQPPLPPREVDTDSNSGTAGATAGRRATGGSSIASGRWTRAAAAARAAAYAEEAAGRGAGHSNPAAVTHFVPAPARPDDAPPLQAAQPQKSLSATDLFYAQGRPLPATRRGVAREMRAATILQAAARGGSARRLAMMQRSQYHLQSRGGSAPGIAVSRWQQEAVQRFVRLDRREQAAALRAASEAKARRDGDTLPRRQSTRTSTGTTLASEGPGYDGGLRSHRTGVARSASAMPHVRFAESFQLSRTLSGLGGFETLVMTHATKEVVPTMDVPAAASEALDGRDDQAGWASPPLGDGWPDGPGETSSAGVGSDGARAGARSFDRLRTSTRRVTAMHRLAARAPRSLVYLDDAQTTGSHWNWAAPDGGGCVTYTAASNMVQDAVTGRMVLNRPGEGDDDRRPSGLIARVPSRRGDEPLPGYRHWVGSQYIDWRGHEGERFVSDAVPMEAGGGDAVRVPLVTQEELRDAERAAAPPGAVKDESRAHKAAAAALQRAQALAPKAKEKAPQIVSAGLVGVGMLSMAL